MTEHGYTYTTLTAKPGEPMRVHTAFYLDDTASIQLVPGVRSRRPFLSIDHGDVGVYIGPRANVTPTTQDVALIRDLAEQATALLAEVERLHAEHHNSPDASASAA